MKKQYKFKNKRPQMREKPIKTVEGVLRGNSRGFAFLCCDDFDDVFIPAKHLGGAMHGDTVQAEVYFDHGEVKKIVKTGTTEITGVYVKEMRAAKVIPDDRHYFRDIYVTGGVSAEYGDRVAVKLSRKDRGKGEIVKNLGKAGSLDSDIAAVIFSLGIEDFKYKAIKEAEDSATRPISAEGRRDFRQQPCFTIDGEGSKDFDDAVYAEERCDGFRLWVHIADVAHYVPLFSHTDKEAFRRGNSFYYGESVIPMLPEVLCNDVCSLNENEPRLTLSVIMDIAPDGTVDGEICEGIICSHKRMTYETADKALNGETDEYAPFMHTLSTLHKIRDVLKRRRDSEGNIDFDIPEPKFAFKDGKVADVIKAPRLLTHSIIEECMIAANRFVATKFLALKAPFVYREHQPPQEGRIDELNVFLSAIGEKELNSVSPIAVANLLKEVPLEKSSAVSRMALRCMSKAKYSVTCDGHFGLAVKEYCHFTSPIRRYSDLTIHRIIKEYLHGEDVQKFETVVASAAAQASERERISEKAEREIDDLYIADYMAQYVNKNFDGVISGVTEWGIYVELSNTAEGMIRAESLGITQFDVDTVSMAVRGKGVFRLGDKIKVTLISASGGNIVFELA